MTTLQPMGRFVFLLMCLLVLCQPLYGQVWQSIEINSIAPHPTDPLLDLIEGVVLGGERPSLWGTQRSQLRNFVLTYDDVIPGPVTADQFQLTNLGVDAPVDADVVFPLTDDHITHTGNEIRFDFLPFELNDGVYELEVGDALTGTAHIIQANERDTLHQFTGDFDGNRKVQGDWDSSTLDYETMGYWFAEFVPQAPDYADLNDDGRVTFFDRSIIDANHVDLGREIVYPNGSSPTSPFAGVPKTNSPGLTHEWEDIPDCGYTSPGTGDTGCWLALPIDPRNPNFFLLSVDDGSLIDEIGTPYSGTFESLHLPYVAQAFNANEVHLGFFAVEAGEFITMPESTARFYFAAPYPTDPTTTIFPLFVATTGTTLTVTVQPELPGDGNLDGWVDGLDYLLWAANYNENPSDPPGPLGGDYNRDSVTDGLDYLLWAGEYGNHAAYAVPEPATLMLAIAGTITLLSRRRRA